MFNYSVVGLTEPSGVFHTVRLPRRAAPGQTLTYEDSGKMYRVLESKESVHGGFGEVWVLEIPELTDEDRHFLKQCGISSW